MSTTNPRVLSPISFLRRAARGVWLSWRRWHRSFRFWLLLIVALIVLLIAYHVTADQYTPLTTHAYAQAYVVQIAPQVAGQVVRVHVAEGDNVTAGDLLFELDPRPYEHRVAMLEARLVEAEHEIEQLVAQREAAKAQQRELAAEAEYAREVHRQEEEIYKRESTTERKYLDAIQKFTATKAALDKAEREVESIEALLSARVGTEHATVAKVKAELAEARLDLAYTKVHAPCAGAITNLQLRDGAYAHVGQAVLTCIDTSRWLIVANFREKCLGRMRPEQQALVAFQAMPGQLWPARVCFVGSGVGQGQGAPSGFLPDVKHETVWLPAAQRFQVRLELDEPDATPLRVGMTASVSVYVGKGPLLNGLTEAVHKIIAWFYYL